MKGALKTVLYLALGIAAVILTTLVFAYGYTFAQLKGWFVLAGARYLGLDTETSSLIGFVLTWIFAPALFSYGISIAWRSLTGRLASVEYFAVVLVTLSASGAYYWATLDWMFRADGTPLKFICPAALPGDHPRIQMTREDHLLGGNCAAVDRQSAPIALSVIRKSIGPKRIEIDSLAELDALKLSRHGAPLIFAGVPATRGGLLTLYDGPGLDELVPTPQFLRAANLEDIQLIRNWLIQRDAKRSEEGRLAKEAAEREALIEAQKVAEEERARQKKQEEEERESRRREEKERAAAHELELQQERTRTAEALSRATSESTVLTPSSQAATGQTAYWYFCNATRSYYPYVRQCPGDWQRIAPRL